MDQTEQDSIEADAEATLGEIEELRRQRDAGREITDVERMGWDMAERMAARVAALEDELAELRARVGKD